MSRSFVKAPHLKALLNLFARILPLSQKRFANTARLYPASFTPENAGFVLFGNTVLSNPEILKCHIAIALAITAIAAAKAVTELLLKPSVPLSFL